MGKMNRDLISFIKKGERKNIEFKEILMPNYHLIGERKNKLVSQMKYRIEKGNGKATYFLGVSDDGELVGLSQSDLKNSLYVLKNLAKEIDASIDKVEKYKGKNGKIAKVMISKKSNFKKEHLLVGVAGHVDHGKSTLLGTLTSGTLDDGSGKTRIFLDVQKHEIERGLSADLSFAVYGFKDNKPVRVNNPLNKKEKSRIIEECDRIVSFVDTVGHEPWLRTTIRGIVGQKLNYGMITVSADEGPTHITKEHLGIILAMDLPVIIVITKTDLVDKNKVEEVRERIGELLKLVGRIPFQIRNRSDIYSIVDKMNEHIVPILAVSSVTGEGLDLLDELFMNLKIPKKPVDDKKPFLMYIDKIYTIKGVGTVVSGTVRQGKVKKGDNLVLGPTIDGEFKKVNVKSIEMHHYQLGCAETGHVVGIALRNISSNEIERGMILADPKYKVRAVREFEAEVSVLVHPTTIKSGYESVTHIETIAETTKLKPLDKEYLSAGDKGKVRMRFKYRPYHVERGQKLVFREGRTKGIGSITKIVE
ncbi:translation elongation factor 1A GTP binding domain family [Methanothermus fervidus DSM 2088]|uniref:Translation elongation factor 1A GTP binding domain family n=1 Tax=Methanothermus fervidus (strain ATCC 43054 / DSM 2088 / JCM 10308 / V24 S) TaxID=523846 RepID=E3GWV8_METFV|nr:translation elongation factor 1A GTP binding domain family [Methanothermus fervidus DSM 2088]